VKLKHFSRVLIGGLIIFSIATLLITNVQPVQAQDVVLVGAGDISVCTWNEGAGLTADLIDTIPGLVFTAGDNVYETGTKENFEKCFGSTWGRFKDRLRVTLGNHDLSKGTADAYYDYFGDAAGPRGLGYYAFDYGAWRIIVMNSQIDPPVQGTAQEAWLKAELANNPRGCTLAIWHHPVFSSSIFPTESTRMRHALRLLYEAGVDIVINGDAHHYERFNLQDWSGRADPQHGFREFIVGTGGASLNKTGTPWRNSQVRESGTWGVIKLVLRPGSYHWDFVPVKGRTFTDSGDGNCVNPAPLPITPTPKK